MDYTLNEDILDKFGYQIKLLFVPFEDNKYSPKFLQSKILFYAVIFILIAKVFFISVSINFPKYTFFADISQVDLVQMVNSERLVLGLKTLSENTKLDQAAMLKAKDMLANGYFAHQSPTGITPWYWFGKSGYNYKYAGENLAIGFTESADVYNAWFNSDSHRENFLSSNYSEVGTAVLTGNFEGSSATVVVQLFGKQKSVLTNASQLNTKPKPQIPAAKPLAPIVSAVNANMAVDVGGKIIETPKKEVLSESVKLPDSALIMKETNENFEPSVYSQFLNTIFYSYDDLLKKAIFGLFIFVSLLSIINIIVNYNFQNRRLVLKSLVMVLLLCVGTFLDKDFLAQIIYHQIIL